MRRLLAITGTLALTGAGVLVAAAPAAATARHVGVVVRYATGRVSAGCARPGGTGLDVLEQHHRVVMGTQQYSGFVLKIDGTGTTRPDNTHYWSYWRSGGGGTWTYSNSGAGSTHPRAGTVEGWSYVNGQSHAPRPPRYTYKALCGRLDPKPKPAPRSTPAQSTSARPTPTHSASSTSSAAAPPPARPTSAGTTAAVRTHTDAAPPPPTRSRSKAPQSVPVASHHSSRQSARPATTAAHPATTRPATTSRPAPVHSSAKRTVATEPTAADKADSGFPAWGTLVAVLVIAGLGVTAWTLARRRAN